ncbi:uncharacterized protein K452DRAFT_298194 [Aplosporella prunicola CBS 121167]|uniref:AAA+ ATPase domain-containing protein n=1 Tax=Aplosporella prunicola CBS 121167 TaxID=1176127 RepID=A0A6A6BDE9_9PEZI|nr:uncharacterized protein K452DRAFT_298194 [Aplosporella prunicola CBS 121167]KAF2142209.1 hypothetical protein K452DRAFT_298194 [Aplosporella prunicola CBS 121167]
MRRPKPCLYVEVRLKKLANEFLRTDLVRDEVSAWLPTAFLNLRINQPITGYESLLHSANIESINVVDFDGETDVHHRLEDVQLDVQAYELYFPEDESNDSESADTDGDETAPKLRVTQLPSTSLDGLWKSLVFEKQFHFRLLRYTARMMEISKRPMLDMSLMNWNRLLLLHGPPGSGKTTLCRALAQNLTIRLGRHYTNSKLVEIDSQSLLSKWFGESGKLVGKIFEQIQVMANDDATLVCVLIDEVETIAGAREKSLGSNDVRDAMRATNQLLTGLDRLRYRSNIIVLCTSNLLTAIDSAFLDRTDVKQFIPNPGERAIYDILRSSINELIRCKLLVLSGPDDIPETRTMGMDMASDNTTPDNMTLDCLTLEGERVDSTPIHTLEEPVSLAFIPTFAEMRLHLNNHPNSPGRRLWHIAQRCQGMSGRALRRLPFLALGMHTFADPVFVDEGLAALELAVDDQLSTSPGVDDMLHL